MQGWPEPRSIKRAVDVVAASIGALVLLPAAPVIAVAIKIDSPGPVIFSQARLGKDGRPIVIRKFRTMLRNAPEEFNADGSRSIADDDPRVTRVGRFLRWGLDELPQVINILKGEMSLVGPRPDDLYAVSLYQDAEWAKLAVQPGITGLGQVSGRNGIPWRRRLSYDCYYVSEWSLRLDAAIIIRTIAIAFGVSTLPLVDEQAVLDNQDSAKALRTGRETERTYHTMHPRGHV